MSWRVSREGGFMTDGVFYNAIKGLPAAGAGLSRVTSQFSIPQTCQAGDLLQPHERVRLNDCRICIYTWLYGCYPIYHWTQLEGKESGYICRAVPVVKDGLQAARDSYSYVNRCVVQVVLIHTYCDCNVFIHFSFCCLLFSVVIEHFTALYSISVTSFEHFLKRLFLEYTVLHLIIWMELMRSYGVLQTRSRESTSSHCFSSMVINFKKTKKWRLYRYRLVEIRIINFLMESWHVMSCHGGLHSTVQLYRVVPRRSTLYWLVNMRWSVWRLGDCRGRNRDTICHGRSTLLYRHCCYCTVVAVSYFLHWVSQDLSLWKTEWRAHVSYSTGQSTGRPALS